MPRHFTVTPLPEVLAEHLAWLRLRGMRTSTLASRRYAINRLARALPVDLLQASADDLDRWQRSLHLSDVSRSNEVANVACFYQP